MRFIKALLAFLKWDPAKSSIRARLIRSFTIAILIPSIITCIAGTLMIRNEVYRRAENRVSSDLESAKEIYNNYLERLRDALRIHATRMLIYGALVSGDKKVLGPEMERVRAAEKFDLLILTDASGRAFYRTGNPELSGDDLQDLYVRRVLSNRTPVSGSEIISAEELARESPALVDVTRMDVIPTPMALPSEIKQIKSGMLMKGAAPVFTAEGRFVGVLAGAVLLNRNYEIVDKIRTVVFRDEIYQGKELGTATIFQDDVRISTNVLNKDGSRATSTRVSAEVARKVLKSGNTWRGRAFVVNDWYISAYTPIRDLLGKTIGMLYVGTLEQPYRDSLRRNLYVFLGITLLGVVIISWVAIAVAQRISAPIRAMAKAAQRVSEGDYTTRIEMSSKDEIGTLTENFNIMVAELALAQRELKDWGENLERKVEKRTAELKAMQAQLIQSEKLAGVGKLAAGIAHEINNPLTCVLTNSSLLLEELPPDDHRRGEVQSIVDETLRCRKIVKGLLDFARQTKPLKQALNMNQIAENVLALVRNQATFRNISTILNLDPNLPDVSADRDQIQQVILNIVLNAADAMSAGGVLQISSRHDPEKKVIELSVSDTGPGIADEMREKLFEPFFTTKPSGTGLGLAIAYGIAKSHNGDLKVDSSSKGTTMTIVLPIDEISPGA
jgi:two-component system, NtrC family, sensor kinase